METFTDPKKWLTELNKLIHICSKLFIITSDPSLSKGFSAIVMSRIYEYRWGNNPKRLEMKGRKCVLLKSLRMGSAIIQFVDNGQIDVTSSRALRRVARQDNTFKR